MGVRQETFAAMGYRVQHVTEQVRRSLLTQIYLLVLTTTSEMAAVDIMDFKAFYLEMLLGLDPEAREAGVMPRTIEELEEKIRGLGLTEELEKACLTLAGGLRPPPPL